MQGLFDLINIPFSWVIRFFYGLTDNYMVALLFFAIVVKLVLFPLGIKQQKNMVKQASLRPKEAAIRAKYAGRTDQATQQKMQNEIMSLYQSENYNPAGGCLPMLLQLLVVWAIYQIVYGPLIYLCGMSAEAVTLLKEGIRVLTEAETYTGNQIQMLHDITVLTVPKLLEALPTLEGYTAELGATIQDTLVNNWPNMTVFGGKLDLSATPTIAFNILLLIPILNLVTTWLSTKITRKFTYQSPDAAQMNSSMKIMEITMPLMIFWMAFNLPAALGVYWIFQNVLGVLQSFILSRMYPYPKFTEEELKEAVKSINQGQNQKKDKKSAPASGGTANGTKKRSLHHIDDEDYADAPAPQITKKASKESAASNETQDTEPVSAPSADNGPVGFAPLKDDDRHK